MEWATTLIVCPNNSDWIVAADLTVSHVPGEDVVAIVDELRNQAVQRKSN